MKTLPIHAIPTSRMAALTLSAQREQRATRLESRTLPGWTDADAPPAMDHPDSSPPPPPDGEMVVIAIAILAGVFMAGLLAGFFIWGR